MTVYLNKHSIRVSFLMVVCEFWNEANTDTRMTNDSNDVGGGGGVNNGHNNDSGGSGNANVNNVHETIAQIILNFKSDPFLKLPFTHTYTRELTQTHTCTRNTGANFQHTCVICVCRFDTHKSFKIYDCITTRHTPPRPQQRQMK